MKRLVCVVSVCGLAFALLVAPLVAQAEKPPTCKDIMGRVNKGPNSLNTLLGKQLMKSDAPAWDDIQKQTKEYAKLAAALGQNDPPRGDKSSWEKLTKAYSENAQALDDAAQKKDLAASKAARDKIQGSCMGCHRAHRKA